MLIASGLSVRNSTIPAVRAQLIFSTSMTLGNMCESE
jgi:hypothetical protein